MLPREPGGVRESSARPQPGRVVDGAAGAGITLTETSRYDTLPMSKGYVPRSPGGVSGGRGTPWPARRLELSPGVTVYPGEARPRGEISTRKPGRARPPWCTSGRPCPARRSRRARGRRGHGLASNTPTARGYPLETWLVSQFLSHHDIYCNSSDSAVKPRRSSFAEQRPRHSPAWPRAAAPGRQRRRGSANAEAS
jgi:hypothetical protein